MKNHIKHLFLLGSVVMLVSCGKKDKNSPGTEYMPDMYYSEAYKPYEMNPLFDDSLEARPPVAGTVSQGAFPNTPISIDVLHYPYPNTPEGYEAAGKELRNPIPADSMALASGQEIYGKFCVHCHGDAGDGNGSIVAAGKFPNPGAYWSKEGLTQGKMFHTLTFGKGMMGSHASQLTKTERWKVVHYVQSLIDKKNGTATAAADTSKKADVKQTKKI
jgi:mono/diheme cytochrome c family protein